MLEEFKNPPAEYRVTPFWFWNHLLDLDEIERQVREMHAKGVGGFFIHGRFGLLTEYMREDWMRCVERACEVAEQLGMHVYLYDENPFPSGVAGGEAMKNEKHFNKFLDIAREPVAPGQEVVIAVPEGKLLAAAAVRLDQPGDVIDLTSRVSKRRLRWRSPGGGFEVLVFVAATARFGGFIYGSEPDYFDRSLVDTFFRVTHERYADRLKPHFGRAIKGIFTDEPKIQCIHHMHDDANTTAWFDDLPEEFRADHGYDLIPNLACLAADAGPHTRRVRRHFWHTVTRCYIERFFDRYRAWCEENGIALTGHLFLEEGLYANTMYQGNFPRVLSEFHIPGVDHLGLSAESDYAIRLVPPSITRVHGQKLGSSVAHLNRTRLLSESYGCAGWTLSMQHMKWILDWQASLGVNLLCPHAFYYSLAGVRKTDAPPSQFYQATYWPHYKFFADYAARLCWAMSQGTHSAQVALLYPIKGFWSEWAPGTRGPFDSLIADYFDLYCAHLTKEHIDYDIIDEESLNRATCVDQELLLAGERYQMLILPPTTAIGYETALKIREFVEDGGKVLGTILLPFEDADGDKDERVRGIFADLFGVDPLKLRERVTDQTAPAEPRLINRNGYAFLYESGSAANLADALRSTVSEAIKPDVSVRLGGRECHDITVVRRTLEEDDFFFFSNNCDQAREVQISVRCEGAPHLLNLENGEAIALPNCTQRGSRTILLHRFEPHASLLMCFGEHPALSVGPQWVEQGQEVSVSGEWQFSLDGRNCLVLREWNLRVSTQQDSTRYEYITSFDAEFVPKDLVLVLDDLPDVGADAGCAGSNCAVFVNGRRAERRLPWMIDVQFQVIDIARLVRKGRNDVLVLIEHGGWSGSPQLMAAEQRLMGAFSLEAGTLRRPARKVATASWTDQGYPFYSGTATYRQTVRIPEFLRGQRVLVQVEKVADMVEFVVNGASAGLRPWPPFEMDITALVKPGPNTLELRVTNSLANLLLSEPRPSGLLGPVKILVA